MEVDLVLRAVMLPAIAVAIAFAALLAIASRLDARLARAVAVLLPVAAVLPAFRALAVQEGGTLASGLSPAVSYGWLPTAFLVGAACAAAVSLGGSRLSAIVASVVAPAAAVSVLSPPGLRGGEAQVLAAVVGAAAALAAVTAHPEPSRGPFVAWWLLLSVASAFAVVSGFAKLAFVAASLAAASAALGVASFAVPGLRATRALDIALSSALAGFAFVGMAYDEAPLPRACWLALALAPAASLVGAAPAARRSSRAGAVTRTIAPAAVAALALAVALAILSRAPVRDADADAYASAVAP